MIKFEIKLGAKHLNMEARQQRDSMQPKLKGLHCRKCPGSHTVISFKERTVYGQLPGTMVDLLVPVISGCCEDFAARLSKIISGNS